MVMARVEKIKQAFEHPPSSPLEPLLRGGLLPPAARSAEILTGAGAISRKRVYCHPLPVFPG